MSSEKIPEKPLRIISADYDTVCIQNPEGKQITFSLLPEVRIDEVCEEVKRVDIPIGHLKLKEIIPLAALPPQEIAEKRKKAFDDKNPTSRVILESEVPAMFGVSPSEYDRMATHARKVLFTSLRRRLVGPES